ncbi:MAG: hypothetical protein HY257_00855, partial [Chloroflexi bacterium]|nr:hypothetical protein [Chloroflexota bacterium]
MTPDWPLYFRDNLTFGAPDHPAAVCCLWMKQARLRDTLSSDSYSILGNLYSNDGINYLLRNILAQPTVRAIILCGPDLTHSGAVFLQLVRAGVDAAHHICNDPSLGSGQAESAQIDREIPRDAIDDVRAHVRVLDLRGVHDPALIQRALTELNAELPRGAFAAPRVFPRAAP